MDRQKLATFLLVVGSISRAYNTVSGAGRKPYLDTEYQAHEMRCFYRSVSNEIMHKQNIA